MHGVDALTTFRIAFAASVALAAFALAAALLTRLPRLVLLVVVLAIGGFAVAAWVFFVLEPSTDLAAAAGGLTASLLGAAGSLGVRWGVGRARGLERDVAAAKAQLSALIAEEAETRTGELERTLARARADSVSLLAEEERRIAEQRRDTVAERERVAGAELGAALATTQQRVEQRLAEWGEDLERAQGHLAEQLQRLAGRQRRLIEEAEERLAADAERLESESEAQRSGLVKLREDLERATEESIAAARAELDAHAADRRRALHELGERLRRRERELRERVEREETEAVQRIQSSFGDIERRLTDRLLRVVERTTSQHVEAATMQFVEEVKRSREDAARRLSRELDRAVQAFAHEAHGALGERMASVGENAAQRLERRLIEAGAALESQREEVVRAIEQRLGEAEEDFRRRLADLAADSEAERGVIEARLHELARRIDQAVAYAQERVSALESSRSA
jgi:hypothetical protein